MSKEKPNVVILATGGTIASRGANSLSLTDYGAGAGMLPVGIQTLLEAVPEIENFAQIQGEQVFNIGSSKLTLRDWYILAQRAQAQLDREEVDGIVITHGTDTLEETAYFLNLVLHTHKPVVLVGSMRPATGMSADGPLNLANAVALAACKEAGEYGVLVAMNDAIAGAFDVMKTNATNVATFKCPNTGYIGYMQDTKPCFLMKPVRRHTWQSEFSVEDAVELPRVEVNFTTLGSDGTLVEALVKIGVKGIINAGVGHANMPDGVRAALEEAVKQGIVVVAATRVPTGIVSELPKNQRSGFIGANLHTPQKARILLMLALKKTSSVDEIKRIFSEY